MHWLEKVKGTGSNLLTRFKSLFYKEEDKVVSNSLVKVAQSARALGLSELLAAKDKTIIAAGNPTCDHSYYVFSQRWVKVASRRFELKNELRCEHCKEAVLQPIE